MLLFFFTTAACVEHIGEAFKMLWPLVTTNYGVQRLQKCISECKDIAPPSIEHIKSLIVISSCNELWRWGVWFSDFLHVVTKGGNNYVWRPLAAIVTVIAVQYGEYGHYGQY